MTEQDQSQKLHIDSDWKTQAQAEKERLSQQSDQQDEQQGEQKEGEYPEANFSTLMGVLASPAVMSMGAMADKESGGVVVDLPGAKFHIDLLSVLEEKTKGNLSEKESTEISQVLNELRNRFVQIANLVAQQQAGQAGAGQAHEGSAGKDQDNADGGIVT